jgi:hypothetical protein
MDNTLRCPACKAELKLPALSTGQTVQCPRCRETVDPAQPFRTALKAQPAAAPIALGETAPLDDHLPDDLRTLLRPDPLHGERVGYLAMALLALSVLSCFMQIGFSWEYAQLTGLEREREVKLHTNVHAVDFKAELARLRAELEVRHAKWKPIGQFATLFDHVTFWPAVLAFLAWLYQASRNMKTLKAFGASHEPTTAVLSFFVPLVNFYWPYVILQEIWQGSEPQAIDSKFAWFDVPASNTIRYWWTLFLTGQVIGWMSAVLLWSQHWDRANAGAWLACLSHLCLAIAGLYLIAIVHRITLRQRERWDRLYAGV